MELLVPSSLRAKLPRQPPLCIALNQALAHTRVNL